MERLIEILHKEHCSCVIRKDDKITLCRQRGVKDLLELVGSEAKPLQAAEIADKVVGKGAAALMILGGVRAVYADVISTPALELLRTVSIPASYGEIVPNIINRSGTDICPVEKLCQDCDTALDCLPLITKFVSQAKN